MTNCVGYIRTSSSDSRLGRQVQIKEIVEYANVNNLILKNVFEDIGVSGVSKLSKRQGLTDCLSYVRGDICPIVLTASLDRIARSAKLGADIEQEFGSIGSAILSINQDATYQSASLERKEIIRRTKAALDIKRSRGERIGTIPYGFKLANDGTRLIKNRKEQSTIATVISLRGKGYTLRGIVKECERLGLKTRTGRPLWLGSIARIEKHYLESTVVPGLLEVAKPSSP